jgi:hypothetical protein
MKDFSFIIDDINLEIVPEEIWSNSMVVFHGTSAYHSRSIEEKGFSVNSPPYDIDSVKILVETLKSNEFSQYDEKKGFFNWTTAFGIEHYLDAIEKKEFRLSFTPLSLAAAQYSFSETKGGQALRDIRVAKQIFDTAVKQNNSLQEKIPNEVIQLFEIVTEIDNSDSVVYAVQIPNDLKGIECDMNNVIYSKFSIPNALIIGKVLVPSSFGQTIFDKKLIDDRIKAKLHTNGGLAIRIWRNSEKNAP